MNATSLYHDSLLVGEISSLLMQRKGKIISNGELRHCCTNPDHDDRNPSSLWNEQKGVFWCPVCDDRGGVLEMARRLGVNTGVTSPDRTATLQHPRQQADGSRGNGVAQPNAPHCNTATPRAGGLTIKEYSTAKKLSEEYLRSLGVTEVQYAGNPAVRMPYLNSDGTEASVRYRVGLHKTDGGDRFRWRKGSRAMLYGLDSIQRFRQGGEITIVEGESCTQTALYHGLPAVGLPGASTWKEDRDAPHFEDFDRINVIIEPDSGGETVLKRFESSSIRDRIWLVDLGSYEDVSGLWLACETREEFQEKWQAFRNAAKKLSDMVDRERAEEAENARLLSLDLAVQPDISLTAARYLEDRGVVGERQNIRIIYLTLVSRLLDKPLNLLVKGTSSTGKSYITEKVVGLFPGSAVYALSGMSEKALIYDDTPLKHRVMVVYEAAGLSGDFQSYLMRSLLSEGRIHYVTVEKTADGIKPKTIIREGPTGLVMTTTNAQIHPENETRMLSLQTTDSQDQTRRIMESIASPRERKDESAIWHALQVWLESANHEVDIPYALLLARMVPPVAVRLRRDFMLILNLIRTNAILHQATREINEFGQIVASLDDYRVAFEVAESLVSAGVEATVPETVRQTVQAVEAITSAQSNPTLIEQARGSESVRTVSITQIAQELKLDKSAASRRVRVATNAGYLRNLQDKRGRPAKIAIGEALPEDQPLLPKPEDLEKAFREMSHKGSVGNDVSTDESQTGATEWTF